MSLEVTKVDPKEYGLDVEKATGIEKSFLPKIAERDGYVSVYERILTKEISKEVCNEASELRKKLVKVRTGIAEIHKTEKAYYLAAGRFVDALKNKLTLPVEQMEEKLSEIEKYYETLEAERKKALKAERLLEVKKYSDSDIEGLDTMDNEMFELILSGLKTKHEEKVKADQEAEDLRIENERISQLYFVRSKEASKYEDHASNIVDINAAEWGKMTDDEYSEILEKLKAAKKKYDDDQEEIKLENDRLLKAAENKRLEDQRRGELLKPLLAYVTDYPELLLLSVEDFEIKLAELTKEKKDAYDFEASETLRKQNEKEARTQDAIKFFKAEGFEDSEGGLSHTVIHHFIGTNRYSDFDSDLELQAFKDIISLSVKKALDEKAEVDKKTKDDQDAIEAEKLAKAPIKKQLNAWVETFSIASFNGENEKAKEIENKFNSFKEWAKSEISKM